MGSGETTGATERPERGALRLVGSDAPRDDAPAFLVRWHALEQAGADKGARLRLAFEHCHRMVYAVASRITQSPWDAEDVTQTAFEELARRLPEIRHAAAIPSFLKTVAVRTSLHRVRRDRWRRKRLEQRAAAATDPFVCPAEDAAAVRQLLGRLEPEERAAVVLKYVEMNSHEEVAQLMGVSTATARRRLEAGRARLVALVGEQRVREILGVAP
jgi:RNA polymerase sigma-70 factor (ECF subfamily)